MHCGPLFLEVFLTPQGNTMAKPFQAIVLQGYAIGVIIANHQASTCGRVNVRAPGPTPKSSKTVTVEVRCSC